MVELSCDPTACPGPEATEPTEGSYFVAAYPPFSGWRADDAEAAEDQLRQAGPHAADVPFGLYVHVPFCTQRCQYCYYLSYANPAGQQVAAYVDALLAELALYRARPALADRRVGFVYFGGGTPSLLSTDDLLRLFTGMQASFPWAAAEEVTFECAPRSTTPAKLHLLRAAGVNRVSLGVQQLDDTVLRRNGRVHRAADVARAWAALDSVGFDEVNIDLMVGLVGETDTSFLTSLERVIGLGPDSVTIYQLEVPHNTPLYRALRAGTLAGELPSWEAKRARLVDAFARLEEAGYRLRSAYAAARGQRHGRFVYQEEQYRGADLVGVGVSSFSYVAGVHYQNLTSLAPYFARVREGQLPISRAYRLNMAERLVREFVLQLKLGRAEARYFRDKFGVAIGEQFAEPLERLARRGWLSYDDRAVVLTRPGLVRVDQLLPAFYRPEHRGVRYS